jgi:hypothetical protein
MDVPGKTTGAVALPTAPHPSETQAAGAESNVDGRKRRGPARAE